MYHALKRLISAKLSGCLSRITLDYVRRKKISRVSANMPKKSGSVGRQIFLFFL